MSRKRGLSVDEKRIKMKEIFLETKDVFTVKDLEKIAPKSKGVIAQSVKEVVQSLADDGEIKNDKIGTSQYFWCFPSDELNNRNVKLAKLTSDLTEAKRKHSELNKQLSEASNGREESEERKTKLQKLKQVEKENVDLKKELQQFADNNPLLVQAMKEDASVAKEAANRWTENIWNIRSYCAKSFNVDEETFHKNFPDIPQDLDYLT